MHELMFKMTTPHHPTFNRLLRSPENVISAFHHLLLFFQLKREVVSESLLFGNALYIQIDIHCNSNNRYKLNKLE